MRKSTALTRLQKVHLFTVTNQRLASFDLSWNYVYFNIKMYTTLHTSLSDPEECCVIANNFSSCK